MLKKLMFLGIGLLPGVMACGPEHGSEPAEQGLNMVGFGFYSAGIIQILVIIGLILGITLLVKNLNVKGGNK